jgi:hypothetical protein
MPMPPPDVQMAHAIEAAARRYRGLQITTEAYRSLCEDIAYGGASFVLSQEPGREVWEVLHQGKKLTAVFDTRRRNIVTFLPNGNCVPGQRTGRDRR